MRENARIPPENPLFCPCMNRRTFSRRLLFSASGLTLPIAGLAGGLQVRALAQAPDAVPANPAQQRFPRQEVCAFIKFVQSLPYDALGAAIAGAGFTGIEATVRKGGIIEPGAAADALPELARAMQAAGCGITLLATDIDRVDAPLTEKVLRAAAAAGVKRYRTAYYRYDLTRPIRPQLAGFRSMARDLAALNRELGLTGVYQNHAGVSYVGASLWDLDELLTGIDPAQLGVAFDIRHATAEGGTTWPLLWKLIEPRVGMVYVKDFVWRERNPHNVPLGEGQVDPAFAHALGRRVPPLPISVHVEYLEDRGVDENIAALRRDRETLMRWLAGA